jgi:hypothetical protein
MDDLMNRPGIRRAFENGRIDMKDSAWKKHVTFDRILLIVTMLFAAGQFWERQQNNNETVTRTLSGLTTRIEAIERRYTDTYSRDEANNIFVRKDLVEVRLEALEQRMSQAIELLKARR